LCIEKFAGSEVNFKVTEIPRRTLQEIVMRYKLAPDLADIFVEGRTDQSFYQYHLDVLGYKHVNVYEVATVTFPFESWNGVSLINNRRMQVIALSCNICKVIDRSRTLPIFIIDLDYDNVAGDDNPCRLCCRTDGTCLEMYAVNDESLSKMLATYVRGSSKYTSDDVLRAVEPVVKQLFYFRYYKERHFKRTAIIDFVKDIVILNAALHLDVKKYVRRYQSLGVPEKVLVDCVTTVESAADACTEPLTMRSNGHDFIKALSWFFARSGGKEHQSVVIPEALGRALLTCVDTATIRHSALFLELQNRLDETADSY